MEKMHKPSLTFTPGALALAAMLALGGCATKGGDYLSQTSYVDVTAPYQITDREAVENIDLAGLLVAYSPKKGGADCGRKPEPAGNAGVLERLDEATRYYNCMIADVDAERKKLSRNALQERLLAASAQRCNAFKGNLQRAYSRTNFGLGLASTIAGTAGALISGGAANYWSGASAIFSGARAEFNQDYMAGLAAYVVIDGIDKRRREVYDVIQKQGQKLEYGAYPVEAAIKDALYYHGLCSVMTGFQVAHDSIKEVENPGLSASIRTLAKLKVAEKLSGLGKETDLDTLIQSAEKIAGMSPLPAGSALPNKDTPRLRPDEEWTAWAAAVKRVDDQLNQAIEELVVVAKGKDELKDQGLEEKPKLAQIEAFTGLACPATLAELEKSELAALLAAATAKTDTQRTVLKVEAENARAKMQAILAVANSMVGDYRSDARTGIDQLLVANSKMEGKIDSVAVAAIKTALGDAKATKLDKVALDKLNSQCPKPSTAAVPEPPQADATKTEDRPVMAPPPISVGEVYWDAASKLDVTMAALAKKIGDADAEPAKQSATDATQQTKLLQDAAAAVKEARKTVADSLTSYRERLLATAAALRGLSQAYPSADANSQSLRRLEFAAAKARYLSEIAKLDYCADKVVADLTALGLAIDHRAQTPLTDDWLKQVQGLKDAMATYGCQ